MIAMILIGAGAGLVVGAVARTKAREAIARELMLGSRRLSEGVREGRATLLQTAPPQIRDGVNQAIADGLSRAGITEPQLRVLVSNVRRLRGLL